jgi:hypothetical protein
MSYEMKFRARSVWVALVAVLALSALAAGAANAAVWKFNSTELTGNETIVGAAFSSSLTIPGATTTCAHFLYNMKIKNETGGKGEITEVPLYECTATGNCTVKAITPELLPWHDHLTTVAGKDYLFIEGIQVTITYSGELCAVAGKTRVTGTAGGLIENETEKATFNKATFEATGAALKVASSTVEWKGEFPTEAFEKHREQKLEG